MAKRLQGKVALISGAASGIGAACARAFVEEGARVVVADIARERGEHIASELLASTGEQCATFVPLDVTEASQWALAVEQAEQRFGGLHILVSCAGVCSMAGLLDENEAGWNHTVAVNQTGTWNGMRAAVPAMRRSGGGSIILISSIWGRVGTAGATAYQATKAAVVQLAKAAAAELASADIRANAILPGIIDTPFLAVLTPEQRAAITGTSLLGREGTPREIGLAATYLASDESSYVTGTELVIDGGYMTC
ncbi:SDR family NAD(P)-dependent oxidoreductase [Paraburkholderia flava]|uniref:SDR family NAD(P)-dependent oxidoreductase n=1 Tax=Paraburkholderia flava TaxID=2547393 RepID=UPI001061AABA|nr:SDR family NAD(P)-dependent oxidoreductase [Paraburkholderia flava]